MLSVIKIYYNIQIYREIELLSFPELRFDRRDLLLEDFLSAIIATSKLKKWPDRRVV